MTGINFDISKTVRSPQPQDLQDKTFGEIQALIDEISSGRITQRRGFQPENAGEAELLRMMNTISGSNQLAFGQPVEEQSAPSIFGAIKGAFVEMGKDVAFAATVGVESLAGVAMKPFVPFLEEQTDLSRPIRTADFFETRGEFMVRRAEEGDPEAQEDMQKMLRGAAFIASALPVGRMAIMSPVGRRLLGARALSVLTTTGAKKKVVKLSLAGFMAAEALGGAIYGTIVPINEEESRARRVVTDSVLFGAFGGSLMLMGRGIAKVWRKLTPAQREQVSQIAAKNIDEAEAAAASGGDAIAQAPERRAEAVAEAIEEVQPGAFEGAADNLPPIVPVSQRKTGLPEGVRPRDVDAAPFGQRRVSDAELGHVQPSEDPLALADFDPSTIEGVIGIIDAIPAPYRRVGRGNYIATEAEGAAWHARQTLIPLVQLPPGRGPLRATTGRVVSTTPGRDPLIRGMQPSRKGDQLLADLNEAIAPSPVIAEGGRGSFTVIPPSTEALIPPPPTISLQISPPAATSAINKPIKSVLVGEVKPPSSPRSIGPGGGDVKASRVKAAAQPTRADAIRSYAEDLEAGGVPRDEAYAEAVSITRDMEFRGMTAEAQAAAPVTLQAYRGIMSSNAQAALTPGHVDSTFMSASPAYSAGYAGSGTLSRVEFSMNNPKLLSSWEEIGAGRMTLGAIDRDLTAMRSLMDYLLNNTISVADRSQVSTTMRDALELANQVSRRPLKNGEMQALLMTLKEQGFSSATDAELSGVLITARRALNHLSGSSEQTVGVMDGTFTVMRLAREEAVRRGIDPAMVEIVASYKRIGKGADGAAVLADTLFRNIRQLRAIRLNAVEYNSKPTFTKQAKFLFGEIKTQGGLQYFNSQSRILRQFRDEGFDGLVVFRGSGNVPEIMLFNQAQARVVSTLSGKSASFAGFNILRKSRHAGAPLQAAMAVWEDTVRPLTRGRGMPWADVLFDPKVRNFIELARISDEQFTRAMAEIEAFVGPSAPAVGSVDDLQRVYSARRMENVAASATAESEEIATTMIGYEALRAAADDAPLLSLMSSDVQQAMGSVKHSRMRGERIVDMVEDAMRGGKISDDLFGEGSGALRLGKGLAPEHNPSIKKIIEGLC